MENLNEAEDVNRTWENIKENIKTSVKESLGVHEWKHGRTLKRISKPQQKRV